VPRAARVCHDLRVHVLLVTTVEADGAAHDVAAAWVRGSARCEVRRLVLSAPVPAPGPASPRQDPAPVFVPTEALGLTTVDRPSDTPERAALRAAVQVADLVVVHVTVLDGAGLHDGPVAQAAAAAAPAVVPVVVLAGRSEVTRRELAAAGVAGVHEVGDPWDPVAVERVARTWAPTWHAGT